MIKFEPRDIWIGLYWDKRKVEAGLYDLHLYLCIIPTFPLHIIWRFGSDK